jgi:predicted ATPase
MFTGDKTIVFRDTEIKVNVSGNKDIELNALSSGEKQALYIFIHTLLAEESTLIIDEPEMSLHIDWQKQLIADMKLLNSNAQFIIATHSPEIMSTLEDKYIFPL